MIRSVASAFLITSAALASPQDASGPPFPEQSRLLRDGLAALGVDSTVDGETGTVARLTLVPAPADSKIPVLLVPPPGGLRSPSDEIRVLCNSDASAAWAVARLLREAEVEDGEVRWRMRRILASRYSYRAFMVDMGRNPHSPETLRKVCDMVWLYGGNVLHLHLTDDQIISWPSWVFPRLYSERAGWTWDDFVALEKYASVRGITIVPEIDVPGHSTILRREYPDVFGETPTDLARRPEAQAGVEALIDEMLSVFTSATHVHIGCDEAYGVPEELQRDFINRLDAFVNSRGRRTVVWEGPSLGEGDNKVDTDVLHVNWRTIEFPAQQMLDAGYQVVNAAWEPMYVVDHYPRTMFTAVSQRRCFEWDPRRYGHINAGIPTFAEPHVTDTDEGIVGFCMPWWEGREENLFALCLPRFAAVAMRAWDWSQVSDEEKFEAFRADYEGTLPRVLALSGIELPELPMADPATQEGNLAFARPITVSAGASQPHFGPQRLTNGLTDRFDHFLGFPTVPEPLEIVVDLGEVQEVSRVVVHETAVGKSFEQYRVDLSTDGETFDEVGASVEGTRGEASFVEHAFDPRNARYVRIRTDGCQSLTFPSFSRLCEIEVFAPR
ncbi:MAG: family 20 glycosylhydrolase [Planctomycetota bacterium]